MKPSLADIIASTRRRLVAAKPHSRARVELELKLRDLMLRELKREIRSDRKAA